jgi:PAS domain S-box-containing protein
MQGSYKGTIVTNLLSTPFLRNILLGSLVITIILPIYSVFFVYPSFNKLLIESIKEDAIRTGSHLAHLLTPENTEFTSNSLIDGSIKKIETLKEDLKLEKIQIFSKSGEILYSSNPKDVGMINEKDYFWKIVAKGDNYTNVVKLNAKTLEGRVVPSDVVETYVPIMRGDKFIGAFEIYYDITTRKGKVDELLNRSVTAVFAITSCLLIAIITILFKASQAVIERNRAEETLRESELKFRAIVGTAKDAVILMDSKGNISYWNPAAEEIFGYTSQEVTGKDLRSLLVPRKYQEAFAQGFGNFKVAGRGPAIRKGLEVMASRKDETEFPMEFSLSSVQIQSEWHTLVIIRDISERKLAEKEQLERGKLQGVIEMAGAACHELNQPVQVISGLTDLLLNEISEGHPLHGRLKTIQGQIVRMGSITKKIMVVTRYETRGYGEGIKIIDIDKATREL